MKKIFVVILSLIYLGSSTGVAIDLQYCMDKLSEWNLDYGHDSIDPHANCAMKMVHSQDDCCKSKVSVLKVRTDQEDHSDSFVHFFKNILSDAILTEPYYSDYIVAYNDAAHRSSAYSGDPPQRYQIPLFLLHRSLRI